MAGCALQEYSVSTRRHSVNSVDDNSLDKHCNCKAGTWATKVRLACAESEKFASCYGDILRVLDADVSAHNEQHTISHKE